MRHSAFAGRAICATVVVFSLSTYCFAAPPQVHARAAQALVIEALHHQALGLDDERERLVAQAAAEAPHLPSVNWAQGKVQFRQAWVDLNEVPRLAREHETLVKYNAVREDYADTVEGQLQLAAWCDKQGLAAQSRAHLSRVLDLEPDHLGARRLLGFVRVDQQWIAKSEVDAERKQTAAYNANLQRWRKNITQCRTNLQSISSSRREAARKRLRAIDDPTAVAAIESLLGYETSELALPAIASLAQMTAPEATEALARVSVLSQEAEVRRAAATALRQRPFDTFIPQLLSSLYTPVEARVHVFEAPGGRIINQQVFVREGQERVEVLAHGTTFQRVPVPSGDGRETFARSVAASARQNQQTAAGVMQQNLQTLEINDRVCSTLALATEQSLGADPTVWWDWWNEHNEVFVAGEKPIVTRQVSQQIAMLDRPTMPLQSGGRSGGSGRGISLSSGSGGNGPGTLDCLVAGTLIWTALGAIPVEQVQIGDLVLSQHPETGELAYQPVLRTTIRPASQLVRVKAGLNDQLEASGGHLFWVTGDGWVKARELRSGMLLHTPSGTLPVSAVEEGPRAVTYNLVVADFHTYFAGYDRVLSHDNTVKRPTEVIVPGVPAR